MPSIKFLKDDKDYIGVDVRLYLIFLGCTNLIPRMKVKHAKDLQISNSRPEPNDDIPNFMHPSPTWAQHMEAQAECKLIK